MYIYPWSYPPYVIYFRHRIERTLEPLPWRFFSIFSLLSPGSSLAFSAFFYLLSRLFFGSSCFPLLSALSVSFFSSALTLLSLSLPRHSRPWSDKDPRREARQHCPSQGPLSFFSPLHLAFYCFSFSCTTAKHQRRYGVQWEAFILIEFRLAISLLDPCVSDHESGWIKRIDSQVPYIRTCVKSIQKKKEKKNSCPPIGRRVYTLIFAESAPRGQAMHDLGREAARGAARADGREDALLFFSES